MIGASSEVGSAWSRRGWSGVAPSAGTLRWCGGLEASCVIIRPLSRRCRTTPNSTEWRRSAGSRSPGEFTRGISGRFADADLVEAIERRPVVRPRGLQHVQHVLGVAHVGEMGPRRSGCRPRRPGCAGPRRPLMGNIEHDAGRGHAHRVEDRIERIGAEIVDLVQCAGAASRSRRSVHSPAGAP